MKLFALDQAKGIIKTSRSITLQGIKEKNSKRREGGGKGKRR